MRRIKKIFTKLIIAIIATVFIMPVAIGAASNVPMTEIGDYGDWMTPENMVGFNTALTDDMNEFQSDLQSKQLVADYVPIEAKIGIALMNGLSLVADVLDSSLIRFAIIFMIVLICNPSYKSWAKLVKVDAQTYNRPKYNYLAILEWGSFIVHLVSYIPLIVSFF